MGIEKMPNSNKNSQKTHLTGYSQAGMEKKEIQNGKRMKESRMIAKAITKMIKYRIQVRYWNFK